MTGPLHGVRIIDFTVAASGPYATMILAEQGADVIKIERPGTGDFMRALGTVHNGVTGVFAGFNRGKRGIAVDVKAPEGVALVRELVARAEHPSLVYVSISGFGLTGPHAHHPAYDSVMQAASGVAAHQSDASGVPQLIRNAVCDKTTALTAAQLITAALFARERGVGGQHLHVSMLHASIAFLWPDGMQDVTFLDRPVSATSARATSPPVRRTRNGYISITTLLDAEFHGLCRVLALEALITDARFAEPGDRSRNAAELHPLVNEALRTWDSDELATLLEIEGVPHAVVNTIEQIHLDPQVVATGLLAEVDHPTAGRMRVPRPVGDLDATPTELIRSAPLLGQHTDEVLVGLGHPKAYVADLRRRGVIA